MPSPRDTFSTTQEEKSISKSLYSESDWAWTLLTASLATTVDNTIKMADMVQKHGCQWCIRFIVYCATNGCVWISQANQVKIVVSLAPQKGVFCRHVRHVSSGIGIEYLLPFVPRITDSDGASRLCRTHRQTHNKDFDSNTLPTIIHEGLSERSLNLFITETTVHQEAHADHGHSLRTGVYTNKYQVIGSSHRVCLRHTRTDPLSNAAVDVVTGFSSSSFAEFSIKVRLIFKNKSHWLRAVASKGAVKKNCTNSHKKRKGGGRRDASHCARSASDLEPGLLSREAPRRRRRFQIRHCRTREEGLVGRRSTTF